MGTYKISDLENLSGIKAHTIRIWEQRYNILTPLRTDTNIRYYDDDQLKKLLNVVSLIKAGNKISHIGKLSEEELFTELTSIANSNDSGIKEEMLINQLISAGLSYDESLFEKAFSSAILSFGLSESYQKVLYPMLVKIGLLWSTSELMPAQEHFVSNMVRQKVFAAIDSLNPPSSNAEKWVLFLPEGELHDIGLLIANYSLRLKGVNVLYLGDNVPQTNLYTIAKDAQPTHYLTFVVKQNQQFVLNDYLRKMKIDFNDPNVYVCCNEHIKDTLVLSDNQQAICSFNSFKELIK